MDDYKKMLRDTGIGLFVFVIGFFWSLLAMVWSLIESMEALNTAVFVVLFLDGMAVMICGLYAVWMNSSEKKGDEIEWSTKKRSLGLM